GSSSPQQVVIHRDGCGGERGKYQHSAENAVSGGERERQLFFVPRPSRNLSALCVEGLNTPAASQVLGHQERSGGHGGQNVARQLRLRCAEKQDGHEDPTEKK